MMRLRLPTEGSTNTAGNGNMFLHTFEHDVNISSSTKVEVFNFICIILKNLIDKPNEPKYRQLRLQNNKIQRYTSHTPIMNYLQQVIGFDSIVDNNEPLLRIGGTTVDTELTATTDTGATTLSRLPTEEVLKEELRIITSTVKRFDSVAVSAPVTVPPTQPKVISNSSSTSSLQSEENGNGPSTSMATTSTTATKLTEKQKARLLLEEKLAMQKVLDEQARKRTIQQIQNDKHVRMNDPNWKPSVSAAAAKSGNAMSTFRDKFGEN